MVFGCLVFLACNNSTTETTTVKDTAAKGTTVSKNWTPEEELEFVGPCVENAKARFGEAKAYAYCKCIFQQVNTKYSNLDSAALMDKLSDTAEIAQMAKNCE